MKKRYAIICMLLTTLTYGQKSTLFKNINVRANELQHRLNSTGDTLLLEGQRSIERVDIFNSDFEKSFNVNTKKARIPLSEIPVGRFVTEVKLHGKLIIITLLRHEPIKNVLITENKPIISSLTALKEKDEKEAKIATVLDSDKASKENEATYNTEGVLPANGKFVKPLDNIRRHYWIIHKINNGHRSRKITRMGDQEVVAQMIKQNEVDLRTKSGKYNQLTIWEVYDTRKFYMYKRRNPDLKAETSSAFFNTTPLYTSKN